MRSHSSCLFHTGQSLLVDFDLCSSTRHVFFLTLVSRCWWTLACALPLVLSFFTFVSRCWWTLACALPLVLSVLALVSRCWRTFACAAVPPPPLPSPRRRQWRRRYGKSLTPTCCRLYNPRLPVKRCNPNLVSVV